MGHCAYCYVELGELRTAFVTVNGTSVCRDHAKMLLPNKSEVAVPVQVPKPALAPAPVKPAPAPAPAKALAPPSTRPTPRPGDKLQK